MPPQSISQTSPSSCCKNAARLLTAPSLCDRAELGFGVFDAQECPSASQICISEQPADWQMPLIIVLKPEAVYPETDAQSQRRGNDLRTEPYQGT